MNTSAILLIIAILEHTPDGVFMFTRPSDRQFRESYTELTKKLESARFEVFFTDMAQLSDDGQIKRAYKLDGIKRGSLSFVQVPPPTKLDIIMNRKTELLYDHPAYELLAQSTVIVNSKDVASLGNKKTSLELLAEFLPETIVVDATITNKTDIMRQTLARFGTVVIKPFRGYGGNGIVVTDRLQDAVAAVSDNHSYIVQKFIETSQGLEGLVSGRHDVRLYVVGGEVIAGSIRSPQKGQVLSNTALGGSIDFFPLDKIPQDLLRYAGKIISKVKLPGASFVSLDFFYGDDGEWYLIEVNEQPGFPATYQHKEVAGAIHNALVAMYTRAITI